MLPLSQSGRPFASPKGHVPTWTSSVEWHAASAFKPETYRSLVGSATAVVHTLGTLLENSSYKQAIRQSDAASLASTFARLLKGENPLAKGAEGSYERINKDSGATIHPSSPKILKRYRASPYCPSDLSGRSEESGREQDIRLHLSRGHFSPCHSCPVHHYEEGGRKRDRRPV